MQDIRNPKEYRSHSVQSHRPIKVTPAQAQPTHRKITFKLNLAWFYAIRSWTQKHQLQTRLIAGFLAVLMVATVIVQLNSPIVDAKRYDISNYEGSLLEDPNAALGKQVSFDLQKQEYVYNEGYQQSKDVAGEMATAKISATFGAENNKDVTITDTVNNVNVTFKPQFALDTPKQNQNRIIYPIKGMHASKVYTLKANGVKEDIILDKYQGDSLTFVYKLGLADGTEARIENDGSLAVYGASAQLLGNVSTSSDKDADLLKKARAKAEKTNLLFRIPAPFILQPGKKPSTAKAWFSLKGGDTLTVHTAGLKNAKYPLSIDPSVYVETASKLMRGNNETNLDFDTDNELIQKGKLTGGRFDAWSTTSMTALNAARWKQGTAVAGGYVYSVGGSSGSANQATVYWAKFNTSNFTIESPNPGAGVCTNWCTDSAYDLPAPRAGLSLVAYNGFLYAIGGQDGSGTNTNTVYIAKLGANGEPSLWHPSGGTPVYWYPSTNTLSSARSYSGAVAYNNRLYLLGGQTTASPGGVTTVEETDLKPTGDISAWTTTGMVALPSARHNHNVQVYNDRMYLIGGNSSGTLQSSVDYINLTSTGTMTGSWISTTAFTTARMAWGGTFSAIWGGYLYVAAGCSAVNGSGYCTTVAGDIQLASINADGTITNWSDISGVTNSRIGYGLVAWRGNLYGVGGCTAQNTTTGDCTTTATNTDRGLINQDGDASTVRNSVASGTSPCVSTTWTNCNMPPLGNGSGTGGQLAGGAVINNGYIYYIGGCYSVGNNSVCFTGNSGKTTGNVSYSSIASDGTLVRSATCSGTYYGSWCVDSTNTVNAGTGLAAFGLSVFNNVIYAVGGTSGTDWQANVWRNPLNSDGSLGTWTSQTFANLNLGNARGYMYTFTRANPAAAGTYPGNLYVIGGCSGVTSADNGLDCSGVDYSDIYKCNIKTDGSLEQTAGSNCTTTGQLQLDSEPGTSGTQGLGVMAGTVYANYIYLIGGQSPNETQRGEVMYAKIDNSNNIVDADGETIINNIWQTSPNSISPARARSVAYGYNGYLYTLAGYNISGSSSLNDLLFAKINVSDGSIGSFVQSTVTVNPRWDLRAVVNNGYVYTLGGCSVGTPPASCSATTAVIQTFQLYNNYSGSPKLYSAASNLFTTDRIGASSTILNGYIYVAGGCTSTGDCTTATNSVQYAPLNADGSVGTWAATTASLPAVRTWGQLETAGGSLYYIGGQDSTATNEQSTVYYATPSSGNVTTWGTATNGLPAARTKAGGTVWNNRIFIVGGLDGSSAATNTVYVSPQLNTGGDIASAWSTASTSFNVARSGATAVAYANNLYVFGGYDGTNYLNDAQFSQIASSGTAGSWSYTTSLPQRTSQADGFAANGFMYLIGGRSADTTCNAKTVVSPISANTTIATGNNPTGLGEWYETNVRYTGNRYGASAVYDRGKAYILGGGCGTTLTYTGTNRVVSSTLQSQPQVAKYSRMIDTDTDVFPTKWLMNGLDNSTGARWYLKYRSSTNSTATWGQETNYGEVTLGTPATYTPLDGSGTNTNFARYYYLAVNIDSQQAFGYPEDVTRGPTIADLSLFFTSDPSKRLIHGKTFTGGEQQPLDTPF